MALQSFTITIGALTDAGNNGKNYVNNQPVYIKQTNGTLASIYRDLAGTSQITQDGLSNVTNSKGQFTFFVDAGDYNAEYQSQVTPITVVGPDYFNSRIDETVNQIILDLSTSRGFRVQGTFAAGFTYELPNDVGLDASGNAWIYTDVDALPFAVPAATSPSFPTYTQVTFNQASNVIYTENGNIENALRKRAGHYTLAEAQAADLEVGQRVVLTDYADAMYEVAVDADTGGFYLPYKSGFKFSLQERGDLDLRYFGVVGFESEGSANHIDSTQAFIGAHDYAKDGETISYKGAYIGISDTVTISKQINVNIDATVQYAGQRDRSAIKFDSVRRGKHYIKRVIDAERGTWHGMSNDDYAGVEIENMSWSNVTIDEVENFTTSIKLVTSGGYSSFFAFNTFNFKRLAQSKNQILIVKDGVDSWFNSNVFNDVVFVYNNFLDKNYARRCIKQVFTNGNVIPCDSNVFNDVRFEIYNMTAGTYRGLDLKRAWNWRFNSYRVEIVADPALAYFADLNCEYDNILNIQLDPVMEVYQNEQNARVEILNNFDLTKDLLQVYKKRSGVLVNTVKNLIYADDNLHTRYRKNRTNYQYVSGVYYRPTTEQVLLNESTEFYATTDRLTENGVNISTPLALYLRELSSYDTFGIEVITGSDSDAPINVAIKGWDDAGNILDLSVNNRVLASNMFWRSSDSTLTQSVQRQTQEFTVNSSLISTLAILISGNLNSVRIYCYNSKDKTVERSVIEQRQLSLNHVLNSKPTNTMLDGLYNNAESVLNSNTSSGQSIAWIFDGVTDSWVDSITR
jgi:hypothetical protein